MFPSVWTRGWGVYFEHVVAELNVTSLDSNLDFLMLKTLFFTLFFSAVRIHAFVSMVSTSDFTLGPRENITPSSLQSSSHSLKEIPIGLV